MNKVWTVEDIKEVLKELSEKMGVDATNIPVIINKRFKTCFGKCWTRRTIVNSKIVTIGTKFEFAQHLLNGDYTQENVKSVIIHEYIHLYTNVTENKNCGHDFLFKRNCRKAGISDSRFISFKTKETTSKYTITCISCENSFSKHRMSNSISVYTHRYRCAKCMGKLNVTQNY